MTVKFSIVHIPRNDSQELHCYHPDCEAKDEPVKVWHSHLVDFEEVRKEVQQHAQQHLADSFKKFFEDLEDFFKPRNQGEGK